MTELAEVPGDLRVVVDATAIRLGIPLVSNDGVFEDTPGLALETKPA